MKHQQKKYHIHSHNLYQACTKKSHLPLTKVIAINVATRSHHDDLPLFSLVVLVISSYNLDNTPSSAGPRVAEQTLHDL